MKNINRNANNFFSYPSRLICVLPGMIIPNIWRSLIWVIHPRKFLGLFRLSDLFLHSTSATHSKACILDFVITIISDLNFKHLFSDYFLFVIQQFSKRTEICPLPASVITFRPYCNYFLTSILNSLVLYSV